MKQIFKPGDKKEYRRVIEAGDEAAFHNETVHHVYATFSLGRDAEYTTRQFVLDMRDDDEEGVGTFLSVEHKNPAFTGEEIVFTAWVDHIERNELICFYEARVGNRLIAMGKTGQKILKKEKLLRIFDAQKA
jgi:fluoroacetyl-CoA thioesterase